MPNTDQVSFTATFKPEKDTKNKTRFTEVPDHGVAPFLETVYVPKWVLQQMGNPRAVRITIEPA